MPALADGSCVLARSVPLSVFWQPPQVKFLGVRLYRFCMLNGMRTALKLSSFMRFTTFVRSASAGLLLGPQGRPLPRTSTGHGRSLDTS